jgi:hypothetical protein
MQIINNINHNNINNIFLQNVLHQGVRRKREDGSSESSASRNDDTDDTKVIRDGIGGSKKRLNAFSTGGGGSHQGEKEGEGGSENHLGALLAVESLGTTKVEYGGSATATNDIDTAHDHDARAIAERNLLLQMDGGDVTEDGSKIYRGQVYYSRLPLSYILSYIYIYNYEVGGLFQFN